MLKPNPQEDNGFLPKLALFTPTEYKRRWWQIEDFEMPLKFSKAENGMVKKNSKTIAPAAPSLKKKKKSSHKHNVQMLYYFLASFDNSSFLIFFKN